MQKLVFFVDDDKAILNLLEYTIAIMEDLEVKTFNSGEDCLANLDLNPDIIILDYIFKSVKPNPLTGLDTLKEIRKLQQNTPVVILTSMEDEDLKDEFTHAGATAFVQKNNFFVDGIIEEINKQLA